MLHISADEANALVQEVDTDGNGEISFDEWISAMQNGTVAQKKAKAKKK